MNAILKLVQGSAEWHAHRALYRNASESAAVMGASPWMTPYQLWLVRTGRMEVPVTAPMRHGTEMEPRARAAYEAQTGLIMQPLVLTDGNYSASLDGITLEGDLLLEVKCPYKGASCKTPGASDHERICSPLWAIVRLINSTSGAYSDPNHHSVLVATMRFPGRPSGSPSRRFPDTSSTQLR